MNKQLIVLLFSVVLLGTPAFAIEIFYPADGTYVVHSDFLIIKAGAGVEALTLEIGGEKSDLLDISGEDYRAAFDDFLIVQPNWDPGKNVVIVESYSGGKKTAEKKAEFFYQDNLTEPPPAGFKPFVMHTPEREALCAGCHNMSPSQAQMETVGEDNPCASCHKRMLDRKNVHGPAGAWQCVYCHDAKSSPAKYQVRSTDGDLCAECHQEIINKFKGAKLLHGPVAVEMCSACHDSHASDHPAQIMRPINEVCLGCHEGIDEVPHVITGFTGGRHPLDGVRDPSRPRELVCSGCHDPHAGAARYYFQGGVSSRMSLCQRCHQK